MTVVNYFHDQLGWPMARCEQRVAAEEARAIPQDVFDRLADEGWAIRGARLLDVGAGQGGALLEALARGADACGVEPGEEFRALARMRLQAAGHDADRVHAAAGETLPFPANSFDYVISLQVLEHVADPAPVMEEIHRVLKPGGQCYIACENYLSFREQHYRLPWLPLLPKPAGAAYLRLLGRSPAFLRDYVHYTTYPRIWRLARRIGFRNLTYERRLERIESPADLRRGPARLAARLLRVVPRRSRRPLVLTGLHLKSFWRVGVRVRLMKPVSP